MIDRKKLAQEMAKIADDLEYGLRPEIAASRLRELAVSIDPTILPSSGDPNEVARWNTAFQRIEILEKAVEKLAQSIHGVTKAGELLAHLGFKP